MAGDLDRVSGLVEAVPADPDAEGGKVGRSFCCQRSDQARIEAAGQEHPDRHIGDDTVANRGRKQFVQAV